MVDTSAPHLLLMACSGLKLERPAPTLSLYQGVMYQSLRKHLAPADRPHIVILSALHGFVDPEAVIAPYDQRMTEERADVMLANLDGFTQTVDWPRDVRSVFLAGGRTYRRVMRAAIELRYPKDAADQTLPIVETHGGIGMQRSQLGLYLRELKS